MTGLRAGGWPIKSLQAVRSGANGTDTPS